MVQIPDLPIPVDARRKAIGIERHFPNNALIFLVFCLFPALDAGLLSAYLLRASADRFPLDRRFPRQSLGSPPRGGPG